MVLPGNKGRYVYEIWIVKASLANRTLEFFLYPVCSKFSPPQFYVLEVGQEPEFTMRRGAPSIRASYIFFFFERIEMLI